MAGTFRPGDHLTFVPATVVDVRPGDVVVYRCPAGREAADDLVHRIVAVKPGGLVARGDNNPCDDAELVTEASLVGRVTHLERAGRICPVTGGRRGLLRARLLRARRQVLRGVRQLAACAGHPYGRLRASGTVARWWRPQVRMLHLVAEDHTLIKYVYRGRTVARYWPATSRFECRKPFDLVIRRPDKA